jgi:hypothetical protein
MAQSEPRTVGRAPIVRHAECSDALTLTLGEARSLQQHLIDQLEADLDGSYALELIARHVDDKLQQLARQVDAWMAYCRTEAGLPPPVLARTPKGGRR